MKILVTAGSKHGATAEIAAAIADTLTVAGHDAVAVAPEAVAGVRGYDAAVIGSAVYAGRWTGPVRQLVVREGEALRARPVWLFSSGPVGDPPKPNEEPADVAPMRAASGARDHRTFAGAIDSRRLGFAEKALARLVKASDGDFRPWDDIRAWAAGIAADLGALPAAGGPAQSAR